MLFILTPPPIVMVKWNEIFLESENHGLNCLRRDGNATYKTALIQNILFSNYTARNITDLLQAVDFTELVQAVNIK